MTSLPDERLDCSDMNESSPGLPPAVESQVNAQPELQPGAIRVQLPSRGFFYEGRLPGGEVVLNPITTQEEKILLSPSGDRELLLDTVLERCVNLGSEMPYSSLLVADKFFLLLQLRAISYGPQYSFSLRCGSCHTEDHVTLVMPDDVQLRVLTENDHEPFEVTLPVSKKVLGLRLLRVRDEQEIARYARQKAFTRRAAEPGDPAYTYRLAQHIVTIDGEATGVVSALAFCETMVGQDSLVIRDAIEDNDCVADLVLTHACSRCGDTHDEVMPLTADFFRPGATRRQRRHTVA